METPKSKSTFLLIFIIIFFSQLIYVNSLSNQFVYDDDFTIVNNYFVKTWSNFPLLFQKDYFKYSGELSYRPVVTLSYFVDYSLWKLNPFGFHLTNTLLHTFNVILLFFLFTQLYSNRLAAFAGTLLFLCHPVITETVNAISYREDLLASVFFIAAFLLYVKINKKYTALTYCSSLVCYLLALFSKEIAVTLPVLIFLYDIILNKKCDIKHKIFRIYPGYILIMIFYIVMRFAIFHNPAESHVSYPNNSVITNILTMTKVVSSYCKLFFFPIRLCADYVIPHSTSLTDASFIISLLLFTSVIVITYKLYFYSRILFFPVVWFFVTLLPVLNIVPIENIMAERYLYLPLPGICMLIGGFLTQHCKAFPCVKEQYKPASRWIVPVILIPVCITLSLLTVRRNFLWVNQDILWTHTARNFPNSFKAHNNLGNIYRNAGKLDESILELKYALKLCNDYIDAHNNLGVSYRKKGMLDEADAEYQKALQLNPHYPYAHNNLGVLYAKTNRLEPAIEEFRHAISNKPDYADAHNNLGATYIRTGHYREAIQECSGAIKFNSSHIDAYYNLSIAYFNDKQSDKALAIANRVLSLDPHHSGARDLITLIHESRGEMNK